MLGWLLQNFVLTALLAGLAWLMCRGRGIGPAARHALWLVVLIKLVTPPVVSWPWALPEVLQFSWIDNHPAPSAVEPAQDRPVGNVPEHSPPVPTEAIVVMLDEALIEEIGSDSSAFRHRNRLT